MPRPRRKGILDPLFVGVPHGEVRKLAQLLDVSRQTLHRWQRKPETIGEIHQAKINALFKAKNLPPPFSLRTVHRRPSGHKGRFFKFGECAGCGSRDASKDVEGDLLVRKVECGLNGKGGFAIHVCFQCLPCVTSARISLSEFHHNVAKKRAKTREPTGQAERSVPVHARNGRLERDPTPTTWGTDGDDLVEPLIAPVADVGSLRELLENSSDEVPYHRRAPGFWDMNEQRDALTEHVKDGSSFADYVMDRLWAIEETLNVISAQLLAGVRPAKSYAAPPRAKTNEEILKDLDWQRGNYPAVAPSGGAFWWVHNGELARSLRNYDVEVNSQGVLGDDGMPRIGVEVESYIVDIGGKVGRLKLVDAIAFIEEKKNPPSPSSVESSKNNVVALRRI